MERTITRVQFPARLAQKKKVAAYARVSTGKDAMLHVFWTGERKTVVWEDASRRDSWTDEMRKIAADRQRRRCAG